MKKGGNSRQLAETLRPELEILLCSGRAQIGPAAKDRVCALVTNGLDWRQAVANATRHRLLPLLYESVTTLGQDLIPRTVDQRILIDALRKSATNAFGLVGELLRLYGLLDAAGIPIIPYKGPVLATLAYGNFSKRDYVDLDFVLPQRYIPQASEVMQAAGYRPAFSPQEAHAGECAFAPGQYSFEACDRSFLVELHTERTLRYFPTPLDFPDLTGRLIHVEIGGQRLPTFSVEDTLVMLCVHGAKHFWDQLNWIFDLAKLITVQEVNWTLLQQIAAKMKSTRLVLLGLYLAHNLFGASLPQSILQKANRDAKVMALAEKVIEQYAGVSDPSAGVWSRAVFRLRSRDGFGQGLRHLLRLVLSPTESDRQTWRLPRSFAPFYAFLRPWRLLRKYGWGSKRR